MLLLIDIGNTNITAGFYEGGIKNIWRLPTVTAGWGSNEYALLLKGYMLDRRMETPEGAVICSVVPQLTHVFVDALKKPFGIKPIIVTHKLKTGLKFRIKNPQTLGADRIANAVGAHRLYRGNLIVIDFGTATTFCVITANGEYLGGAIMPGLGISVDALYEKTAELPKVKLKPLEKAIGDDTRGNMLSGLILGHAGGVERIIKEIKKDVREKTTTVATGGLAPLAVPYIRGIKEINPNLTLEGLGFIYELNT